MGAPQLLHHTLVRHLQHCCTLIYAYICTCVCAALWLLFACALECAQNHRKIVKASVEKNMKLINAFMATRPMQQTFALNTYICIYIYIIYMYICVLVMPWRQLSTYAARHICDERLQRQFMAFRWHSAACHKCMICKYSWFRMWQHRKNQLN